MRLFRPFRGAKTLAALADLHAAVRSSQHRERGESPGERANRRRDELAEEYFREPPGCGSSLATHSPEFPDVQEDLGEDESDSPEDASTDEGRAPFLILATATGTPSRPPSS
jgi:hypothetical protein